jgi:hypothetical protein
MMKRSLALIVVVVASLASERALAEAWVAKMFAVKEHDFGTVARGADTIYRFEAKNIYKQDIELISVRSSCGCTSPSVERKVLKTGDIGFVTAKFNTRTFTGLHGATLTVEVAWNDDGVRRRGETQLRVNGNIRGDVVFKPGAVRFDGIDQGKVSEQAVEVSYEGRSGWKIVDVRGASDDIEVELTRKPGYSGRVAYELLVRLKDTARAGYFNEQLVLVTNDDDNPRIPMHIGGRVIPSISVRPEPLMLGAVAQGGKITKKVLVTGKQPFKILSVQCDDEQNFHFNVDSEASVRHMVEITFDANKNVGAVKQPIHFATDLGEKFQATVTAYATITAPPVAPAAAEPATAPPASTEAGAAGTATADSVVSQP